MTGMVTVVHRSSKHTRGRAEGLRSHLPRVHPARRLPNYLLFALYLHYQQAIELATRKSTTIACQDRDIAVYKDVIETRR